MPTRLLMPNRACVVPCRRQCRESDVDEPVEHLNSPEHYGLRVHGNHGDAGHAGQMGECGDAVSGMPHKWLAWGMKTISAAANSCPPQPGGDPAHHPVSALACWRSECRKLPYVTVDRLVAYHARAVAAGTLRRAVCRAASLSRRGAMYQCFLSCGTVHPGTPMMMPFSVPSIGTRLFLGLNCLYVFTCIRV